MPQIITLTEYKTAKGITDSASDTQLDALLPLVSDSIEDYCNREFGVGNFTEKAEGIVDYQGRFFIRTRQRPIAQVFTIDIRWFGTLQSMPLNVAFLDLFEKEGYMYYAHAYDTLVGIIRDEYKDNYYYTISYSGGMPVPKAVKLAAIMALSDLFETMNAVTLASGVLTNNQLKSVKIGDYAESYETGSSSKFNQLHDKTTGVLFSQTVRDLLNPFVYRGQSW